MTPPSRRITTSKGSITNSSPMALRARESVVLPVRFAQVFKAAHRRVRGPQRLPVEDRGLLLTFIFFMPKRMGEGQFYLLGLEDKEGKPLDGSKTYRLKVPANAPAKQYWSATLYDRETHALIRNMSHAARSSQSKGLQVNKDGSVDLYFGRRESPGGQRIELDSNRSERGIRDPVPLLRPASIAFRQDMGAAGRSNSRIETTSAIPLADDPSVPSLEFLGQADAECPHRVHQLA